MILYENSVTNFVSATKSRNLVNYLVDEYNRRTSRKLTKGMKLNWKYTMEVLRQLVEAAEVNGECGIRIDYVMLEKHARFEILLAGTNPKGEQKILQMGLFSGVEIRASRNKDFVIYVEDESEIEGLHPSLQSVSYNKYITRENREMDIESFVYLYECEESSVTKGILDNRRCLVDEAPIYFAEDEENVIEHIEKYNDLKEGVLVLNLLHNTDHVGGQSAEIFLSEIEKDISSIELSQDQLLTITTIVNEVTEKNNTLILIDGDPGTGKTMSAIMALKKLQDSDASVGYVSSSYAQASLLKEQVQKSFEREIYIETADVFLKGKTARPENLDVLVIDEAQNLVSHSIYNGNKQEIRHQFAEIIEDIPVVVIIHSALQMVMGKSVEKSVFEKAAENANKQLIHRYLSSNIRFTGKGSGARWLAHQFQVADTENFEDWDYDSYKIEMVDKPEQLREKLMDEGGSNRILVNATSFRDLKKTENGEYVYRLEKENYQIPMHLRDNPFIDNILDYAGNVYNVQGLDFDFCGVIIGPEMSYDEESGMVIIHSDKGEKYNTQLKNMYHVLLSRATKGVYIYISDEKLRRYFDDKLFYSSRRFVWIKELANQYTEEAEMKLLEKKDNITIENAYVIDMYIAVNDFIEEIKRFSENELDEAKYKEISDKCSEFLLRIQMNAPNIENIKNRYETNIIANMGENAWSKLSETGRKCLISAEMTYQDMRDYNSLYDFSSVCLQASKAAEYELTNRFFEKYVEYLESVSGKNREDAGFLEHVPGCMTKTYKARENGTSYEATRLLKETEVTLGTIQYLVGMNSRGRITDEEGFASFSQYSGNALLAEGCDIQETLCRHIKYILRIKNDYRNKAAHKDTMDVVVAKECLDYVVDIQRILAEMLDDYRE